MSWAPFLIVNKCPDIWFHVQCCVALFLIVSLSRLGFPLSLMSLSGYSIRLLQLMVGCWREFCFLWLLFSCTCITGTARSKLLPPIYLSLGSHWLLRFENFVQMCVCVFFFPDGTVALEFMGHPSFHTRSTFASRTRFPSLFNIAFNDYWSVVDCKILYEANRNLPGLKDSCRNNHAILFFQ